MKYIVGSIALSIILLAEVVMLAYTIGYNKGFDSGYGEARHTKIQYITFSENETTADFGKINTK